MTNPKPEKSERPGGPLIRYPRPSREPREYRAGRPGHEEHGLREPAARRSGPTGAPRLADGRPRRGYSVGPRFFPTLSAGVADLNVVFASTARRRQNFSSLHLEEAVSRLRAFGPPSRIGLVFGNERTGLTSAELARSNFRYSIPQAARQPSYNLASAVLLTLFGNLSPGGGRDSRDGAPPGRCAPPVFRTGGVSQPHPAQARGAAVSPRHQRPPRDRDGQGSRGAPVDHGRRPAAAPGHVLPRRR